MTEMSGFPGSLLILSERSKRLSGKISRCSLSFLRIIKPVLFLGGIRPQPPEHHMDRVSAAATLLVPAAGGVQLGPAGGRVTGLVLARLGRTDVREYKGARTAALFL